MFCGAFTTRIDPKLTTNCRSIVMPTMLMQGVATPCSTKVDDGQQQAQHRQDEERAGVLEAELGDRKIGKPYGAVGLQERRAEADADAEQHDGTEGIFGCASFQVMMPDPWQEHQGDGGNGGR
jgi:hypothetical protein